MKDKSYFQGHLPLNSGGKDDSTLKQAVQVGMGMAQIDDFEFIVVTLHRENTLSDEYQATTLGTKPCNII